MRGIAFLLVCAGLALAYATSELVRGSSKDGLEPRASGQALAALEAETGSSAAVDPPEPARSEKVASRPPAEGNIYYQYVDGANRVQFARSLDEVPEEWRDRAGRVSLSVPPPVTRAGRRAGRTEPAAPAVRHSEGTFSAARSEERARQPDIEIYTTKSCGYCRAALAHMDKRGLEYTNHDIEEEPEAREEYLEKTDGRKGVPVIDIEGEIMQGWNRQHFETLLASMR